MTQRKAAKQSTSKASAQKSNQLPAKNAAKAEFSAQAIDVRDIRRSLGLTRPIFSRLSHFSERAIADWEAGQLPSGQSRQRMIELRRLQQALSNVIQPDYVGEWLQAPNDAFAGLKPLEVIERGETDRIWRMIHLLQSGVPS